MAQEDSRDHHTGQGMVDPRPALAIGALVLILIAVLVILL
jgi:hypothetical protein